ncbi:hypothetical protein BT67DRAFT_427864 [Trichocladium antarcticum]|uniref:Rhodopsin domain-containing protein n=1 Tax=Trichocladium antarcticum TaxID=1450529 RepID=A0AAN6ZAX3_9PEZI|nr:hypothetical protein BT67DRAFT_427864 [Trichocladium antarcticum]
MALYSNAPPARPFSHDKPTLLTSWWITIFCAIIILLRLAGRYVRVERLFGEDKIAALVLIPLFLRMAFVHPVLVYGTNNLLLDDASRSLTDIDIAHRVTGSRLVLVSRILQPTTLWLLKLVTLEFFGRLVGSSGRGRYTMLLRFTRGTLAVTFVAVVISNLAECRPFAHYWQVTPDPGPQCRQAYVHLLTATACNALTDLLLVVFPVPIVVKSRIPLARKTLLVMLFCLHLFTVVVAVYRVPEILRSGGYQATRTMWASGEVFIATFAANALTLGTFVRDTGVKKQKFKYQPTVSSKARTGSRADARPGQSLGRSDLKAGSPTGNGERARRSESQDPLIPRSRAVTPQPDGSNRVIKTTVIEVTVSAAGETKPGGQGTYGMTIRPADSVATVSARGRGRRSSVLLQSLSPLPDAGIGIGQEGQRREM